MNVYLNTARKIYIDQKCFYLGQALIFTNVVYVKSTNHVNGFWVQDENA